MKKYFPILLSISVFTAFLAGQVVFDLIEINARQGSPEKEESAHQESIFRNSNFTSVNGKKYNLKEEKAPIVIINFWASWCIPCLEEFPSIISLRKKFTRNQILILGVNTDEDNQLRQIRKTVKKHKLNFPIIADANGKIVKNYLVSAIPVSYIFHRGKLIKVSKGAMDFTSVENIEFFNDLLSK